MRPEVLNLTDVLADLRMLLTRLVGTKIKLKVDHGRDLWPVKVDISQFEQVIVNLAVNARDAMPHGRSLTVRTRNVSRRSAMSSILSRTGRGDFVLVEIEDTGTGIAPDVLKKIFEPFFTTKEVGKGTGLGLSMVYGIIKQTGGFIFCDSEVGKGTVFRIFLPRHVRGAAGAGRGRGRGARRRLPGRCRTGAAPVKRAEATCSGSATVLLVEDEDAVRMGGMRALTSRGYTVHEASSGVEALEVYRGTRRQGRHRRVRRGHAGDGRADAARRIAQARPGIKFIFVSGYAEDAFAKNFPDAKFGFLPKPFSLKQSATVVKEMLEDNY